MRKALLLVMFLFPGTFFLSSQAVAGPVFKILSMSQIKTGVSETTGYVDLILDAPIICLGHQTDKLTVNLGPVMQTSASALVGYAFANYTNLVNAAQKSLLLELVSSAGYSWDAVNSTCYTKSNKKEFVTYLRIIYQ